MAQGARRRDLCYFLGMLLVSALLVANLFKPTAPYAYDVSGGPESVAVDIAATQDSAWVVAGNRVYYISLKERSQIPVKQRTINIIDATTLE